MTTHGTTGEPSELAGIGPHDGIRFAFDTDQDVVGVAVFTKRGDAVAASLSVKRGADQETTDQVYDAIIDLALNSPGVRS